MSAAGDGVVMARFRALIEIERRHRNESPGSGRVEGLVAELEEFTTTDLVELGAKVVGLLIVRHTQERMCDTNGCRSNETSNSLEPG